jgi:hypothetical protein
MPSGSRLYREWDQMMMGYNEWGHWWIGKGLEWSCHGVIEVLSQNLPVGVQKNHNKISVGIVSIMAQIRTMHLKNARLKHYR